MVSEIKKKEKEKNKQWMLLNVQEITCVNQMQLDEVRPDRNYLIYKRT